MESKECLALAYDLFQEAYQHQMDGELDRAIELYRRSIEAYPTAEAYTFLGWTYSFQGKLDDAIAECKKAIRIDPDFGNPYNDIGAYLIEKNCHQEAIPWLLKAATARRYDNYHFAHYNLGRAYISQEMFNRAKSEFERALKIRPDYVLAQEALATLKKSIH
jgi:tetratricopeptide (TPR) repeat protein